MRNDANECFCKFNRMLSGATLETFTSLFEIEREKYLNEHVEELKKERAYANKLQQMEKNECSANQSPISLTSNTSPLLQSPSPSHLNT